jgi:hypothetical protein
MNPNKEKAHWMVRNVGVQFYRFLVLNFKILRVMAKGHGPTRS